MMICVCICVYVDVCLCGMCMCVCVCVSVRLLIIHILTCVLALISDLSNNRLTGPIPTVWCDGHVSCDLKSSPGPGLCMPDCNLRGNPGVCVPATCSKKRACQITRMCDGGDVVVVNGRRSLRAAK